MSAQGTRNDLERLKTTSAQSADASPFRTAVRNIIAACRNSPLALATYCREGAVPVIATSLTQVRRRVALARAPTPAGAAPTLRARPRRG